MVVVGVWGVVVYEGSAPLGRPWAHDGLRSARGCLTLQVTPWGMGGDYPRDKARAQGGGTFMDECATPDPRAENLHSVSRHRVGSSAQKLVHATRPRPHASTRKRLVVGLRGAALAMRDEADAKLLGGRRRVLRREAREARGGRMLRVSCLQNEGTPPPPP